MSRANAEKWEDLELRLAPSFLSKERSFTSLRGPSELIVIDDEEEEEQAYYDPIASREVPRFSIFEQVSFFTAFCISSTSNVHIVRLCRLVGSILRQVH